MSERIEIHHGMVQQAFITDGEGARPLFSEVGQFFFFVNHVDENGNNTGLYDTKSYEKAIQAACDLADEYDCEVHDLVLLGSEGARE